MPLANKTLVVRAKLKAMEDMPKGLPCCDWMRSQLVAWGERIISIYPARKKKRCHCLSCKAPFSGTQVVGIKGYCIDVRVWEIDEGAAEC
jgi:hypothetical protein